MIKYFLLNKNINKINLYIANKKLYFLTIIFYIYYFILIKSVIYIKKLFAN